jgi:hypothetical protein
MGKTYSISYVNEWPAYHDAVLETARRIREKAKESNKERKEGKMAIKGNNLKAEMARVEMGSRDLGEKLGIGSYAVESYCDDMATMPAVILYRAASLFGCSTDWLLGMSDERTPQSLKRITPW